VSSIVNYKDLLLELDILRALRADLIRQLEQHHRVVWTGMAPSEPMPVHVPLDKSLSRYNSVVERLVRIETEIAEQERVRREIEAKIGEMSSTDNVIAYKRYVEGKSLKEIAAELGYTYGWVRQRAQRTNNEQHY
jgi:DNA-directed RNA polymerase specialized sigma24 family protein